VSNGFSIVVSIYVTVGKSLPSQCLATAVSSNTTILAFRCHVTFNPKVTGYGVLYPVQIVSYTQYIVKESRQSALPITSILFKIRKMS
jgi:hypothetical protein